MKKIINNDTVRNIIRKNNLLKMGINRPIFKNIETKKKYIIRHRSEIKNIKSSLKNKEKEMKVEEKRWLKPIELEEYMGMKVQTQAHKRMEGAIPFCKLGKFVIYDRIEIDKWIEKHKIQKIGNRNGD